MIGRNEMAQFRYKDKTGKQYEPINFWTTPVEMINNDQLPGKENFDRFSDKMVRDDENSLAFVWVGLILLLLIYIFVL